MLSNLKAQIIIGEKHSDFRGSLRYFNDFDLSAVKRLYILEHPDTQVVRAWQGHRYEKKWFNVVAGGFEVVLIRIDNWLSPSENIPPEEYSLTSSENHILHVPGGYATGFRASEPNSKMLVFSNFSVEESQEDDYRFDAKKWFKW
ncbi:hypothetical protein [Desertivirga xinjiangensis]|uniref:hypothetical protein n=1 Tax=Desertivirga xinjiangensis TaxID=539206 RepID=UPI00210EB65A|nr:hypothetical protein [Pedobacter xinjiangensis]